MSRTNFDTLLEAGCHFGHLKRKWNPAMAPYIFMERNGIHIIDLHKTVAKVDEAAEALKQIAKSGKKVLFVATKKQAKQVVAEKAQSVNMPYVIERWPCVAVRIRPTMESSRNRDNTTSYSWMNEPIRSRISSSNTLSVCTSNPVPNASGKAYTYGSCSVRLVMPTIVERMVCRCILDFDTVSMLIRRL